MQIVNFFHLPLVSITPQELPSCLDHWLLQGSWVVTVNAEMLLRAKRDPGYAQLLRQADVLLPDGFGVVLWSRGLISDRFPGVDLSAMVLDQAERQHLSVACLVSSTGLSQAAEVATAVHQRWPLINVASVSCDPTSSPDLQISALRGAQVVLVNFGVPAQDQWLAKLKTDLPGLKIGIGVGGTFDFWTTRAKRAPSGVRRLGLESLWRLTHQPGRVVRIWKALVVFSWYAFWNKPVTSVA